MFAIGGGNVAGLMVGVVTGVISSRVLGPALRGEVVVIQTWAGTAAVLLTLGMTQAIVIDTGSDSDLARPLLLQAGAALTFGFALFITLAVSGTQPWMNSAGIVGGAALTAGSLISSNSAGLAQRHGRMTGEFQRVRIIPQVISALAVIWLWRVGTRETNTWLLALGLAILLPSCIMMLSLLGGPRSLTRAHSWLPPRQLARRAGGAFLVVVGSSVIYRLDGLLVAVWMPSEKVAFYAVAIAAAGACAMIGQAAGMLVFSDLRGITEGIDQRSVIFRGLAGALVATSAVAIPLTAIAPRAIQLVYGSAFVPAAGATRLLVLASIPLAADYLLLHALLSIGAERGAFGVQILAGLLTVSLLMTTIPTGRLELVALVSVGVYFISAMLLFIVAIRHTAAPRDSTVVT